MLTAMVSRELTAAGASRVDHRLDKSLWIGVEPLSLSPKPGAAIWVEHDLKNGLHLTAARPGTTLVAVHGNPTLQQPLEWMNVLRETFGLLLCAWSGSGDRHDR